MLLVLYLKKSFAYFCSIIVQVFPKTFQFSLLNSWLHISYISVRSFFKKKNNGKIKKNNIITKILFRYIFLLFIYLSIFKMKYPKHVRLLLSIIIYRPLDKYPHEQFCEPILRLVKTDDSINQAEL